MSATATLYELADMREVLDRIIDEAEGELTPEIEAQLDALVGKTDEKIERVGLFIRECITHAAAVSGERDRLAAIVKREERAADSMKRYLLAQMTRLGKDKVVGLLCTVATQKNSSASIQISVAPEELWRSDAGRELVVREELVTYTADRAAILARWTAAPETLPPTIVVEQGRHVRIR